jgi:hypothetical protein
MIPRHAVNNQGYDGQALDRPSMDCRQREKMMIVMVHRYIYWRYSKEDLPPWPLLFNYRCWVVAQSGVGRRHGREKEKIGR